MDGRISWRFEFVPDADLVAEISSSELAVLPYRELHSSGAALVALSLGRPILVPETTTTLALRDEVGPTWVHLFSPPLTAASLADALKKASLLESSAAPDLRDRSWREVRRRHHEVYRSTSRKGRAKTATVSRLDTDTT